jgi:hypothetical protein
LLAAREQQPAPFLVELPPGPYRCCRRSGALWFWRRPARGWTRPLEGKAEADNRVERSLYERANGYSYDAEKIFCDKNGKVTRVPYREHVPPDVTAGIFWLKNRDPAHWRDAWQVAHTLGKYIISDRPMTAEEWIKERATVIDVTPEK